MNEFNENKDYRIGRWDLSELLPSEDENVISDRLKRLRDLVGSFEEHRAELSESISPAGLIDILVEYEHLVEEMQVLSAYGSLRFAADTLSPDALTLRNRIQHVLTALGNRTLFFPLWWKNLEDVEAESLLPENEEHSDYRHFLKDLRRFAPFTLDEKSEQIINLKDADGINALLTLYSMLTNRLVFTLEINGEEMELTRDELVKHVRSPHADLRESAYKELYRVYREEAPVLAQIYASRVLDWHSENMEVRRFESPIAVRNLANDVTGESVDILLDVTKDNAHLFRRYFELKAGWLGLEKLRRYDLYAPLAGTSDEVPYREAVKIALSTFSEFDPHLSSLAERVFSENHIDSEIRKGKQSGAFCATVLPAHAPWLLLNYAGEIRDVATLAHELGHAVHSMLASEHSIFTQHPSLPLAETASVFGEMLVTDRLLAAENDPLLRRELLVNALDDIYATVLRQAYFVLFEIEAHRAILEGRSPEDLNELYLQNLKQQFMESMDLSEDFSYEWLTIPHIYSTPFYCYAYSFGQLLVLSLYRRFQQEGDAFKPGYLRLLSYGGSARPHEILSEAGIDMTDRDFWQGGFEVVSGMIEELEGLEL